MPRTQCNAPHFAAWCAAEPGATDASFANRSGKAVVVESFGLAGFGYHARDEYIDTGSIVPRLYLMTRMLTELGRGSEDSTLTMYHTMIQTIADDCKL